MPRFTFSAVVLAAFLASAFARTFPLAKRQAPSALVAPISLSEDRDLSTRSLTTELPVERKRYLLIRLEMGSNNQPVEVAFDTGSYITWVNPECDKIADESLRRYCEDRGRFSPEDSKTYKDENKSTETSYINVKNIELAWGRDTIKIAGREMKDSEFAIATNTNRLATGILGAGRRIIGEPSPFPVQMWNKDLIKSPLFSLYIGSDDKGTVVFGGIDSKKFTGRLQQLAVDTKAPGATNGWWIVPVESMSLSLDGKDLYTLDYKHPMVIDSGAPRHIFPPAIADAIAAAFAAAIPAPSDAQKHQSAVKKQSWKGGPEYFFLVDCAHQNLPGSLNLQFNEITIHIPFSDFVVPYVDDKCALNFRTHTYEGERKDTITLGHALLRHAYVVFNLKNDVVFIAKKSTCTDSLIEDVGMNEAKALADKASTCT